MKWLHLSDIHFRHERFTTEQLRDSLLKKLKALEPQLDFIIITGDVFYQNDASGNIIPDLKKFIKDLAKCCGLKNSSRVFICEGNHDINRDKTLRNNLIENLRSKNEIKEDDFKSLVGNGNDNFRSMYRTIKNREYKEFEIVEPKDLNLRLISINSCLLSKDNFDYKNLRVCVPELQEISRKIKNDEKLNLVIMHHSVDWLHPDDERKFEHWAEDNFIDALFVGHTHQPSVMLLNDVNRNIFQFTSGALVIDGHAVPTFFICDDKDGKMNIKLYSFSESTDSWGLGNQNLRKFKDGGNCAFFLDRLIGQGALSDSDDKSFDLSGYTSEELIEQLNKAYENRFGSRKIYSVKTRETDTFNAWKMVGSLGNLGIPYPIAIKLSAKVVGRITSKKQYEDIIHAGYEYPSSSNLRNVIEDCIMNCRKYFSNINDYDIGIWLNRYSRHYNQEIGLITVNKGVKEQLSFNRLRNNILKEVIVDITGNEVYYDKIPTSDLETMAADIMNVIKSLGINRIDRQVLCELISEYVSEPPRPWFVNNNRQELVKYHKDSANKYITELNEGMNYNPALQISAAYHLFAAFLALYDNYLGCTEVGSIRILRNALCYYNNNNKIEPMPPILRYMLVQLGEDLKARRISFDKFKQYVDSVYNNIVECKNVTDKETVDALIELMSILSKIEVKEEETWEPTGNIFMDVFKIFHNAIGFEVRMPMKYFNRNAFVFSPYWDEEQKQRYGLGDDILVCLLNGNETMNLVCSYLSQERKKQNIRELVLFKPEAEQFTQEERRIIREQLKDQRVLVRCVFIQERDFHYIETNGWREELFKVIMKSKNSMN